MTNRMVSEEMKSDDLSEGPRKRRRSSRSLLAIVELNRHVPVTIAHPRMAGAYHWSAREPARVQMRGWARGTATKQAITSGAVTSGNDRGEVGALKGTFPGNPHLAATKSVRRQHHRKTNQPRTLAHTFAILSHLEEAFRFHLRPIQRMQRRPGRCRSVAQGNAQMRPLAAICPTSSRVSTRTHWSNPSNRQRKSWRKSGTR